MLFRYGSDHDYKVIYGLCQGLRAQNPDCNTSISTNRIRGIIGSLYRDFPHDYGLDKASPFKKAAAFLCDWVATKPLIIQMRPEPDDNINMRFALMVVIRGLYGAVLLGSANRASRTIRNPIELSHHSFEDLIDALSEATVDSFKLVSVLLEQIAYKTNPHCQYPDILKLPSTPLR